MNDSPKICVVVPVRNRPDLLRACLRSLISQEILTDSYQILVCDDGSAVDLFPVIEEFQPGPPTVSMVSQKPRGPAAARNMGIRSSNADIFVCVDSDVVCAQAFLSSIVSALRNHNDWVAAEASIKPIDGEKGPLWDAPFCSDGGRYHTAAIAYKCCALREAGGFDETFPLAACEDVDLAARLLEKGEIGFVPEAMVFHPQRRITLRTHWLWRQHWRYVMILAKRYGFLAFPGATAGRLPRLRVALAAILTLPGGRFLKGCKHFARTPAGALTACFYALFDVVCGICALPSILFSTVPPRQNYLAGRKAALES